MVVQAVKSQSPIFHNSISTQEQIFNARMGVWFNHVHNNCCMCAVSSKRRTRLLQHSTMALLHYTYLTLNYFTYFFILDSTVFPRPRERRKRPGIDCLRMRGQFRYSSEHVAGLCKMANVSLPYLRCFWFSESTSAQVIHDYLCRALVWCPSTSFCK